MTKKTVFYLWPILMVNTIIFMLLGCTMMSPTVTTPVSQTSTVAPEYLHYSIPAESVNTHLEFALDFNYPADWILAETWDADEIDISLGDPTFLALPTPSPEDFHPTPSDLGSINIWVAASKPGQTPANELDMHMRDYRETSWMLVLNNYNIKIDGYDASVLEYQIKPTEGYPSLGFNRRVFFAVKDEMYEIYYTIAEKDRGEKFEKGYEYFFNSLKIIP